MYDNPTNIFVAGFIGSPAMNLLPGRIRSGARPGFELEGGITLPLARAPDNTDGRPAIYGVRPEHLLLDSGGAVVDVNVVEPLGSETQLFAHLGGQKIVGLFHQRLRVAPGERLTLMPDPAAVHLFDAESGRRL